MGCSPQLSSCKPKEWGLCATQRAYEKSKDSQEPWPNGFCVNKPLTANTIALPITTLTQGRYIFQYESL